MMKKNVFLKLSLKAFILSLVVVACSKDDTLPTPPPEPPKPIVKQPITISCDYLSDKTGNVVLKNDPDAPVDYVVDCILTISRNVNLSVEPGTVVAFKGDSGFKVNGSLTSVGTKEKPIVFTGLKKEKGSWLGIIFFSSSVNNNFKHTHIEYGGGGAFNSNNDKGGLIVYSDAGLKVDSCSVKANKHYGINARYSNFTLSVENTSFKENDVPVRIEIAHLGEVSPTNDFKGNINDYVELKSYISTLKKESTLKKVNVPYRVFDASSKFQIRSKLTIEPGIEVQMADGHVWQVIDGGSLYAVGTRENPIVFTGAEAKAGYWGGINFMFTKSINNQIQHAKIMYAGNQQESSKGALSTWADAKLNVEYVDFSDIPTCAFHVAPRETNPNLTYSNCTFTRVTKEMCYKNH